jgi:pyruvate dehydrogenase (quinone)
MNVGDFLIDRLKTWGVTRIYGYPGDGIDGVIGSLQDDGGIDLIQVRHEEMAAFMAVGHAKFTGELGVCLATGGPGATHLITGLYDAKLDHMPVLAICGQAETTVRGGSYQQELNLDRMFADVAAYVQEVTHPAQLRHVVDRAIRIAIAQRAPAVVILPKDVQERGLVEPARAHGFTRSGHGYARPVNNMAVLAAAERFLAKHLGGRYQESMPKVVATRLGELTVDVKTVTLTAEPKP